MPDSPARPSRSLRSSKTPTSLENMLCACNGNFGASGRLRQSEDAYTSNNAARRSKRAASNRECQSRARTRVIKLICSKSACHDLSRSNAVDATYRTHRCLRRTRRRTAPAEMALPVVSQTNPHLYADLHRRPTRVMAGRPDATPPPRSKPTSRVCKRSSYTIAIAVQSRT